MSLCTQFWVLLPKARGQWACDTVVAVTPWLGTAAASCAFVCACVPQTHVHIHAHVCLCPWAHPCLVTGHPTELCRPIPGIHWDWQSSGCGAGFWKLWTAPTMAVQQGKQLSGSYQSVVVWWAGESVPHSRGCSSPVHPQGLGQASCPWLPACGGCPSSAHPLWGVLASLSMQASRAARDGTTSAGQHLCLSHAMLVLLHILAHQLVGEQHAARASVCVVYTNHLLPLRYPVPQQPAPIAAQGSILQREACSW